MTAEELLHVYIPDKQVELVKGVLVVRDFDGLRHGRVVVDVMCRLANHVDAAGLDVVCLGKSGFTLARDPDTVRAPDIAAIARHRLPDPVPTGYAELAPDLVVEVLSPGDRPGEVLAKVADWLSAGSRLVWVLDPARRAARAYRDDGTEQVLTADESLDGEAVVPGFSCPLGELFQT